MAIAKRLYCASVWRARAQIVSEPRRLLKLALAELSLKAGEKFSYRVFEGGNGVECVVTDVGPLRFAERGK